MKNLVKILAFTTVLPLITSCDMIDHVAERSRVLNNLEDRGLALSKENRGLMLKISNLKDDINSLKNQNHYLKIQVDKMKSSGTNTIAQRTIASVAPVTNKNDLVRFDVYKWKPAQMLGVAESEFESKNFEKSAQFFQAYANHFSTKENYNDSFLFQAGVAAFESHKHYDWAVKHFDHLVKLYPTSKFYRGAKLWRALAFLKLGDNNKFFKSVEEFRKKYRNTSEWKILRPHYESIIQKHKN